MVEPARDIHPVSTALEIIKPHKLLHHDKVQSMVEAGIHYLRENPERFIESNTKNSWNEYLSNMSLKGSWCDALIVQAVAESQNLRIHIVESDENFAHTTLIEPVHLSQQIPATIYLGHVNEVHYVSTVPYTCSSNSLETHHSGYHLNKTKQHFFSEKFHSSAKRKCDNNMSEYRKKKMCNENNRSLECGAEKQSSTTYKNQNSTERNTHKIRHCVKRNHNAYMRKYREKKNGDETSAKTKHNAYMRQYRKKKKGDESRKGKSNTNNPSLTNNSQNSKCEVEKENDGTMREYNKQKMADKISAKTKHNAYMREYRKKKKGNESRTGKSNTNNPSLTNNNQNSKCEVEKENDGTMREYNKQKMADKISAKTKHNAYMREYRNKKKADQNRKKKSNENNHTLECEVEAHSLTTNKNQTAECQNGLATTTTKSNEKNKKSMDNFITRFHKLVFHGPLYICSCCGQLWYKHSVSCTDTIRKSNPATAQKYLTNRKSVQDKEFLCRTCPNYLAKNKVPPSALVNGMQFATKPEFFDLNELECRLLAPRIAFQKLMQAPRGRQFKIHGNVVNVPADVSDTVSTLPRLLTETGTIKVNLKRRLQYKSSALSLNIRPHKVVQAANWLISKSSLYRQEGRTVNQNWGVECSAHCSLDNSNTENQNEKSQDVDNASGNIETNTNCNEVPETEDEWNEDEAEIPAGVTDTMLTSPDFVEDSESQDILNVVPGEGNEPLSIFRDQYSHTCPIYTNGYQSSRNPHQWSHW